jgi:hypothetical protein
MKTVHNFRDLKSHFDAKAREQHAEDIRKAENLRRSAPLRKTRKPGTGPAVAR